MCIRDSSYAVSISTLIVALTGPFLGSIGDRKNSRKPIFTFFMMIGVLGLAALSIPVGWIAVSYTHLDVYKRQS